MLSILIFLIMILIIATSITIKFKFKQENSILITFLSMMLLTYLLGLFDVMLYALYIVAILDVLGIIYIIYNVVKKKVEFSKIFTLGTIIYIIVSLLIGIFLKDTYFAEWDELSHWGPNLKAMVANDLFWANDKYDGIHVAYQPLAGIFEYWLCKLNGGFTEPIAYVGMDIAIFTLLLPCIKNLKYKKEDIIKLIFFMFSVFCLIYIFKFSLASIYIDLVLGIMFAIGMYIALTGEKVEDKILILLILISMVELKTTGILLDGIILIVLFFKKIVLPIIENKKITKNIWKNVLLLILILLSIFIAYKSWSWYCEANNRYLDRRHDNNFISEINIKDFIKAVLQYNCDNEKLMSISKSFYEGLNQKEIINNGPIRTVVGITVVIDLIMIFMYIKNDDKKKKIHIIIQGLAFNIGLVLYSLLLMGTYMFAFTEVEGRGLYSFDRYMSTYFIAWIINIITLYMNQKQENKNEIRGMLVISLICLLSVNIQSIIHPIDKSISGVPEYIKQKAEIVNSTLTKEDKVYVIFQDPGVTIDPFAFRYCISPIVMNLMDEYSLGKLDSENDTMTYNITLDEWEQKLINENYDYVFILKSDEEFINTYGSIFSKDINLEEIEDKIFKVNKINEEKVELTLYSKN